MIISSIGFFPTQATTADSQPKPQITNEKSQLPQKPTEERKHSITRTFPNLYLEKEETEFKEEISKPLSMDKNQIPSLQGTIENGFSFNSGTGYDDIYFTRSWTAGDQVFVVGEWFNNQAEDILDFGIYAPGTDINMVLNGGYDSFEMTGWAMATGGGSPEQMYLDITEAGTYYIRIINYAKIDVTGRIATRTPDIAELSYSDQTGVWLNGTAVGNLTAILTSELNLTHCFVREMHIYDNTTIWAYNCYIDQLFIYGDSKFFGVITTISDVISFDYALVELSSNCIIQTAEAWYFSNFIANDSLIYNAFAYEGSSIELHGGSHGTIHGEERAFVSIHDTTISRASIGFRGDAQAINFTALPTGYLSSWQVIDNPERVNTTLSYNMYNTDVTNWTIQAGDNADVGLKSVNLYSAVVTGNGSLYCESAEITYLESHENGTISSYSTDVHLVTSLLNESYLLISGGSYGRIIVDDHSILDAHDCDITYPDPWFIQGQVNLSLGSGIYTAWTLSAQDVSGITIDILFDNVTVTDWYLRARGNSVVRLKYSDLYYIRTWGQGTLYVNNSNVGTAYAHEDGKLFCDTIYQYDFGYLWALGNSSVEINDSSVHHVLSYNNGTMKLFDCVNSTAYSGIIEARDKSRLEIYNCQLSYFWVDIWDDTSFYIENSDIESVATYHSATGSVWDFNGHFCFTGVGSINIISSIIELEEHYHGGGSWNLGVPPVYETTVNYNPGNGLVVSNTWVGGHWLRFFDNTSATVAGTSSYELDISVHDEADVTLSGGVFSELHLNQQGEAYVNNAEVYDVHILFSPELSWIDNLPYLYPTPGSMLLSNYFSSSGPEPYLSASSSILIFFHIHLENPDLVVISDCTIRSISAVGDGAFSLENMDIYDLSIFGSIYCQETDSTTRNIYLYDHSSYNATNIGFEYIYIAENAWAGLVDPYKAYSDLYGDIYGVLDVSFTITVEADPYSTINAWRTDNPSLSDTSTTDASGIGQVEIPVDWWTGSLYWGSSVNITGYVGGVQYKAWVYLDEPTYIDLEYDGYPVGETPDTSPPVFNSRPSDVYYSTDNYLAKYITWYCWDENPHWYNISVKGETVVDTTWDGNYIDYRVDGWSVGTYRVDIYIYDADWRVSSDTVYVYVSEDGFTSDSESPTSEEPSVTTPGLTLIISMIAFVALAFALKKRR